MGFLRMLAGPGPSDGGGRSPDDDFWYSSLGNISSTGMRITPESAMKFSTVFACANAISGDLSSLPVSVYEKKSDGSRREATEHPIYKLLKGGPNPFQTTHQWRKQTQFHLELRGNAYCLKIPGKRGAFDQLLPVHPDRVIVWLNSQNRLMYKVRQNDGTTKVYTQDEMLHFKGLSADGITGISPIGVQADSIGLGISAQQYGARFFENDGTPPGVITVAGTLKTEQVDAIRRQVAERQTGANRFKVMVIDGTQSYKDIPLKNTDAQFLESRKFSQIEVCGIFGVPPHRVGILDRAIKSNIEHQGIEYIQYCIGLRATNWEDSINQSLIMPLEDIYPGDFYASIDFDALMRGDQTSRYTVYSQGIVSGVLNPNEARRKENLPPYPLGEGYLMPSGTMPRGSNPAAGPSADDSGAGELTDDDASGDEAEGTEDDETAN